MLTDVSQGGVEPGHLVVDRRDTRMAIEASLLPPLFDARGVAIVATDVSGHVTAMSPPARVRRSRERTARSSRSLGR
jgi:hypothetical protein